jgi:hypothetical protein
MIQCVGSYPSKVVRDELRMCLTCISSATKSTWWTEDPTLIVGVLGTSHLSKRSKVVQLLFLLHVRMLGGGLDTCVTRALIGPAPIPMLARVLWKLEGFKQPGKCPIRSRCWKK